MTACLQAQDFGGPSVLSRGGAAAGTRGGAPINFVYYGGFNGIYTHGAVPLTGGPSSNKVNLYGASFEFGLTGSHLWRRSMMGIDYRGNFRYDNNTSYQNGSDHALSLYYSMRPSKSTQLLLSETATSSSFAFGNYTAAAGATTDFIGVPLTDIFDSRVYSTQSTASFSFRQSRTIAYQVVGQAFKIYRSNANLVGVNGGQASAYIRYAPTRRIVASVGYIYNYYSFPRAFGNSNANGVSLSLNWKPTRGWTFGGSIGAYRVESTGVQTVTLIPEIADLLGVPTSIRSIHNIQNAFSGSALASYSYRRSNFTVQYSQGLSPGNGIYLTSNLRTFNVGYSYSGLRKLSVSVNAGYDHYDSVFQDLNTYGSYQAGFTLNYSLRPHIYLTSTADFRNFSITQGQSRIGTAVSIGVLLSPSRLPLPAW